MIKTKGYISLGDRMYLNEISFLMLDVESKKSRIFTGFEGESLPPRTCVPASTHKHSHASINKPLCKTAFIPYSLNSSAIDLSMMELLVALIRFL